MLGVGDVTGGKGTMKRRQQLRQLMEVHDMEEHQDDVFDSTPFRKKTKSAKYKVR